MFFSAQICFSAQISFPVHKIIPGTQWAKNGRKTLYLCTEIYLCTKKYICALTKNIFVHGKDICALKIYLCTEKHARVLENEIVN